jgi:hypothetical protein
MKILCATILCTLAFTASGSPEASIAYFSHVRDVAISARERQNYLVVDPYVWGQAREDLGDLRLYDGASQVPYELRAEQAGTASHEFDAKILNLGRHGDHTEFDLDVSLATEYNRIHLTLDHKDFLVTAMVEGRDTLAGSKPSAGPSPSTLFDFSREKLGSNSTIALPLWSFRYVHVRLSPGILPVEVKLATVDQLQEEKARWTDGGSCRLSEPQKRNTVFMCDLLARMPVDRVHFDVSSGQVNFRRMVSVADEKGVQVGAGNISRIRMNRGGTTVDYEDLDIRIFSAHPRLTITVDNGDDSPLRLDAVRPQAMERRLYFEPQGRSSLSLYYGDSKLGAPVYDYAKFFREDAAAVRAQLGGERKNAAFSGRPDDRPWSERHKGVLWAAMLLAIAVLTLLAIRGLRTEGRESN